MRLSNPGGSVPVVITHKTVTADGIEFEKWAIRQPSNYGEDLSTVQIVGVGEAGNGIVTVLYDRLGLAGITFQTASPSTSAALGDSVRAYESSPFDGANLVVIIAAANEEGALDISAKVSAGARETGAQVVAMLAQPPFPLGTLVRSVAADLADHIDGVIFLPEFPHPSVLHCLLELYLIAMRGSDQNSMKLKIPTGGDFLDVRDVFEGATDASIGVGHSDGPDRTADAVQQVIHDIGRVGLAMAGGLLVMVAGAESLRLQEIAAGIYGIWGATPGDARAALAVHYDDRLGDVVRIAVIAVERDD